MTKNSKLWNHFYWHVLLLGSLIFSHPLFKTLSSQPEFLLAHNLTGLNLFYWIMVVGFFPGLILVSGVYVLTRLFKPAGDKIKTGSLLVLLSLFIFIQINNSIGSSFVWPILVSCLLAIVTLRFYRKSIYLHTLFSYATLMVVIIPAIFSLATDVRQILLAQHQSGEFMTAEPIDERTVVLLLLDELPLLSLLDSEGKINEHRFPNLANFSSRSTWYKYATAVAEATLNAVPPILTGQLTETNNKKLPLAANYPENIFTLLSRSHAINAFETFTQICPEDLCKSARPNWQMIAEDTLVAYAHVTVPDQFKQKLPQIDNKWVGYLRDKDENIILHTDRELHPHHRYKVRLEKFGQFMTELGIIEPASLNYLHILMPHSPWMYLPDGRIYSQAELRSFTGTLPPRAPGAKQNAQLYSQEHLVDHANQRHLLQAGYVDKLLGDVLSLLQKRDLFDDAMIIIMADHGVSFKAGESLREANETSYQDILSVPLFIKYPGQKHAEISLRAARTVDVLPTILDALNSDFVNRGFDGKSLLQADDSDSTTLDLQRDTGEILNFQFADFISRFEETVKSRKNELANGKFDQIYALNDQGLLNKAVNQLPAGRPVDYTLILDNPQLYDEINLTHKSIPALIRANRSLQPEKSKKSTVAVSINGIIRGVSILQRIETVVFDFQVLVAPDSFHNGANSIRFYQVDKTRGTVSLSPILYETKSQVELINTSGKSMSLNFNSQRLPVARTGAYGVITLIADDKSDKIRLTGWSANSQDGRVAAEIFFFSGNKLITSVKPHSRYPQAQEFTGFANSEYSGFNLIMSIKDENESGPEPFTAIGVFDPDTIPVAGELRYVNTAKHIFKTRKIKLNRETLVEIADKNAIEPGRVYDFSNDSQALMFSGSGWSTENSQGARWNSSNEATLSFTVKSNQYPLMLIVQSSPFFIQGKHELQSIEVSLLSGTRQLINLQRGETDGKFTIHIAPQDIGPDGAVLVRFKFLNAASPKSLGINNDGRMLAIRVKKIQVLIAEEISR